ncbi:MAG: hypothetical protein KFB96_00640 [Thiocapsa sp.]|uniref:hypothetical protein n=1 Tax=Thiocapsa sp. TaxID=2024551 RepID=UPI001BD13F75|nr:hypothetical protein [Thiocapsa sp.]QVL49083.1 MAG: hypothetical protein KFB96_00640 [Thiocapsa sp.]
MKEITNTFTAIDPDGKEYIIKEMTSDNAFSPLSGAACRFKGTVEYECEGEPVNMISSHTFYLLKRKATVKKLQ